MRLGRFVGVGVWMAVALGCTGGSSDEPSAAEVTAQREAKGSEVCACMAEQTQQVEEAVAAALPEERELVKKRGWAVHLARCVAKSRVGLAEYEPSGYRAGIEKGCSQHVEAFDRYENSIK